MDRKIVNAALTVAAGLSGKVFENPRSTRMQNKRNSLKTASKSMVQGIVG